MTRETRATTGLFSTEGNGRTLRGYASVFDSPTQITEVGRRFTEIVSRGAFSKTLASGGDIIACYNHDQNRLLARTANGSLRLHENDRGLVFELDIPDTPTGHEVRGLVHAGVLTGASFSFTPRRGGEKWDGDIRTLSSVFLFELGPVALPAYSATSLDLRQQPGEQQQHANYGNLRRRLDLRERF